MRRTPPAPPPIGLALQPTDALPVPGQALSNVGRKKRPHFVYQAALPVILSQELVREVSYGCPALPEWCLPYDDRQQETAGLPDPDLVGGTQYRCQAVIVMKPG